MNKAELVDFLLKQKDGQFRSRTQAERSLNAVLKAIETGLSSGDARVSLSGFGSLRVTSRKAREANNPATGERIAIDACKTVRFVSSAKLKDLVN